MRGAQGSSVVRVAMTALILFLPGFVHAATPLLLWGNTNGTSPAQITITDGGTYTVPLNVEAPAHFSLDFNPEAYSITFGTLSRVGDGGALEQVAAFYFNDSGGGGISFAWPAAGTYELDVRTVPLFRAIYNNQLQRWLADLFAPRAYAQPTDISETIHFTIKDASVCTHDCFSNVLFLPGIEASRLYGTNADGSEKRLWEPGFFDNLHDLYLHPEGTSVRSDVYAKEGNVIDETPVGTNIYKSFIAKMDDLKAQGRINDWEAAPYDWRLSLEDILNYGNVANGKLYYSGDLRATSTPYIIQELRHLAASSKSGKVTIVAHSNGGLVAKRLTELLGPDASALIDKMIFIAVPQAGTPDAIVGALHGEPIGYGLVASKSAVRTFASTSPMVYHLLPSAQYFTYVDDPVVTFDPTLTNWIAKYGAVIHSQERLHTFLADTFGRVDAETGDIDQPIQLNNSLLSNAEVIHTDLDTWTPPSGVQLIQIAGWGVPTTVTGINYMPKGAGVKPEPNFTIDGDGTVVVPSALWTSTTTGAVDYWMDLDTYNRQHPFSTGFGFSPFGHANILETNNLRDFLTDLVTNNVKPLADYVYVSTESPASTHARLRYALHSPLTLNLYDEFGHHTGVSTTTGQVEEQIPGTYYLEFGDVKYIFSDASDSAHIFMDGYGAGTFTFNVDELAGDTLVASTTFKDIPTTPDTLVTIDATSGVASLSPLHIDKNGDGVPEINLPPKLNGTVTPDTSPPEAVISADLTAHDLSIVGTDDTSSTTVVRTATNATITDASGNTTLLTFQKIYSGALLTLGKITGIKYGADATIPLTASFVYVWDSKKTLVSQTVTVDRQSVVQALYDKQKNRTTVIVIKKGSPVQTQTLTGLILIKLTTKKGVVGYGW